MASKKSLENVLCMKGGSGASSYAHNSATVQTKIVESNKEILEEGIEENVVRWRWRKGNGVFRIADLGCATGMSTLLTVDTIVKAVRGTFIRHSMAVPEFQAFFADLPSNDFNSLLRALASIDEQPLRRHYFAAAVTGSFYRRLFPRRTLNFVHSSLALHWLSRVPESVEDRRSEAWNGGRIFISGKAVAEAYLNQFTTDLTAFLRCRAHEMLPGGCMHLAFLCRNSPDILHQDGLALSSHHLESAFHDLVREGLMEEEKVDTFNMPFFAASAHEFKSIVEAENSFNVEKLSVVRGLPSHPMVENMDDAEAFGRGVAGHYRALFESIVEAHLRSEVLVDELFLRIQHRATKGSRHYLHERVDVLVAFLIRKSP